MKTNVSLTAIREKLTALTPPQKVLLFIVTLLVLGGGFYLLKFNDQLETIDRLTRNIGDQEKKLASLKAAQAKVGVLEKDLVLAEAELAELATFLPEQKEIPGLLENVSTLGAKVGLENILFQPQPEMPQDFYAMIPVKVDLAGSYNDLGVFLDSISKMDRILRVDSMTLTREKQKEKSGGATLKVNCNFVTYRFLDKPVAQAGAKKK